MKTNRAGPARVFLIIGLVAAALGTTAATRGGEAGAPLALSFVSHPAPDFPPSFAETVLTIASPPQEFPLATTRFTWETCPAGSTTRETERLGLAPETVQVTWLIPNRLLWIRWETCAEGTGRFIEEGHLLLLASGPDWLEVFRDQFESLTRFDDGEITTTRLSITRQGQTLFFRRTRAEEEWFTTPPPVWSLLERRPRRGKTRFLATVRTTEEWEYRVGADDLEFVTGRQFFETGRKALPSPAIAKRFDLDPAVLLRLNPARPPQRGWRGKVILAEPLPPCQTTPTPNP